MRVINVTVKNPTYDEIKTYNEFAEAAYLNKKNDPWFKRKPDKLNLGYFEIIDCQNDMWWYNPFIGVKFLGEIKWDTTIEYYTGIKTIKDVTAIAMIRNIYYVSGKSIHIKDIKLL